LSMVQPAKLATPETAVMGFVVQARVAPAGVVMVRLTGVVLKVMVLPPASWTATSGWVPNATLPVELDGWVMKASLLAGPVVMVTLVLRAAVRLPEVAVSV